MVEISSVFMSYGPTIVDDDRTGERLRDGDRLVTDRYGERLLVKTTVLIALTVEMKPNCDGPTKFPLVTLLSFLAPCFPSYQQRAYILVRARSIVHSNKIASTNHCLWFCTCYVLVRARSTVHNDKIVSTSY